MLDLLLVLIIQQNPVRNLGMLHKLKYVCLAEDDGKESQINSSKDRAEQLVELLAFRMREKLDLGKMI